MITFPNAKINLGLQILSRRPDGFHEIETVMWPLKLADVLEIIPSYDNQFRFTLSGHALPADGKPNLCERAWQLMHQQTGIGPVHMHLHKAIPSGSGLGGGSSDAAFTLKLLNDLFSKNLSIPELKDLAASLGSDCPFFIENTPAIATGRGEMLNPIGLHLRNLHLVLVVPNVHISTAEAYSKAVPRRTNAPLLKALQLPLDQWNEHVFNQFEESVFDQHFVLWKVKKELYSLGASYASMSGSGSAIFGLFENPVSKNLQEIFQGCFVWEEYWS